MRYPHSRSLLFPIRSATALGIMLALVAGCGGDDDDNDGSAGEPSRGVSVQFKAEVNGQDFVCGRTYTDVGVGQPGTYQINDWRFYVHDVVLVKPDGGRQAINLNQDGVWQYQNVALLDVRRDCGSGPLPTHAVAAGTIASDNYSGICFKLGLPFALNHSNEATAPAPLNNSGMFWNWRGGYKFIRIDGVGDPDTLRQSFVLHLGSTQCPGDNPNAAPTAACGYPNVAEFCLDNFNVDQDRIVMDVGRAFEASNVTFNTPDTAPGCMSGNSDPECIPIMPRLNLDFTYVAGAGASPEQYPKAISQRLFSVRKP